MCTYPSSRTGGALDVPVGRNDLEPSAPRSPKDLLIPSWIVSDSPRAARTRQRLLIFARIAAGAAYVLVVLLAGVVAFNAGSNASAEAGRCLPEEGDGAWGVAMTALLGALVMVPQLPPIRRVIPAAALWWGAGLAGVVWVAHLGLLLMFGSLLIDSDDSFGRNLANLATVPFSIAPTTAVLSASICGVHSSLPARRRALITAGWVLACTAIACIAWLVSTGRC